jgi:hypothetical protein
VKRAILCAFMMAWVLWVRHETIGVEGKPYDDNWIPEIAYPGEGYSRCVDDARVLARRKIDGFRNNPRIKLSERTTLIGGREQVHVSYKTGEVFYFTYACFPDTVSPKRSTK